MSKGLRVESFFFGIIKHHAVVKKFVVHQTSLRQTWDNNVGVIMHLKNAVAFKYQKKKETVYDSFDAIHLTRKQKRKLREIVLSRMRRVEGEMKNSFETIKIIFVVIFQ